jgi:hypothetical protein
LDEAELCGTPTLNNRLAKKDEELMRATCDALINPHPEILDPSKNTFQARNSIRIQFNATKESANTINLHTSSSQISLSSVREKAFPLKVTL